MASLLSTASCGRDVVDEKRLVSSLCCPVTSSMGMVQSCTSGGLDGA